MSVKGISGLSLNTFVTNVKPPTRHIKKMGNLLKKNFLMLSRVLLIKLGGVVVVGFGLAVTLELPANELVVFSAIALLTTLTINTIKVNLSFIAVDFLRYLLYLTFFCIDLTKRFLY